MLTKEANQQVIWQKKFDRIGESQRIWATLNNQASKSHIKMLGYVWEGHFCNKHFDYVFFWYCILDNWKALALKSSLGQENLLTLTWLLLAWTLLIGWKHLKRILWLNLEWSFHNVEIIIPFSVITIIGKTFASTKTHSSFLNFREATILKFFLQNFSQISIKFHFFQR